MRDAYRHYVKVKPDKLPCRVLRDNEANDLLINRVQDKSPLMVSRLGSTEFQYLVYEYYMRMNILKRYWGFICGKTEKFRRNIDFENILLQDLHNYSGYFNSPDFPPEKFYELMIKDMEQVDILGVWLNEGIFRKYLHQASFIPLEQIEPYLSNQPWSENLNGKRVLVVHPFSKSISKQYEQRTKLFADTRVLPEFELIIIPAVQSLKDEPVPFYNWLQALDSMKTSIDQTEFDIAIIGCGAYGFPLAAHIKRMGKKVIHMGGATQVLFGIRGNRWESIPKIAALMNENWIRPDSKETTRNSHQFENACYW